MAGGFQLSGFQNDKVGPNKGFQAPPDTPSTALFDLPGFKQVGIDSTMELLADRYNVECVGTQLFTDGAFGDTLDIVLGLKDPLGGPDLTITSIVNGPVDEWELTIEPQSQRINLRGRDPSALALDREMEVTYVYAGAQGVNSATLVDGEQFAGGGELQQSVSAQIKALQATSTLYPAGHVFIVGVFTAKQIATDLVARLAAATGIPLTLDWQVRDYTFRQTFAAKGRVAESLKALVQPWQQVEPFKADLYLQGTTVVVRHRQLPTAPLTPGYTMDITSLRRTTVKARKRFTRLVGRLRLVGMLQVVPSSNVTVIANAEDEVTIVQTSFAPDPQNPGTPTEPGNMIRTVVQTTYRLPQQLVTRQIKDTYAPFQVFHERTDKEYDDVDTGPRERRSVTATREFDTSINAMIDSKRVTKTTIYDDVAGQVQCETLITELFDTTTNEWSGSTMVVRTFTDVAPQMVEIITQEFASASTQGVTNQLITTLWTPTKRDSQIAAGHRACGSGRGIFIPNSPANTQPIVLEKILSTSPFAEAVEYSNPNMSLQDLQFLQSLFTAENELDFEYEVEVSGVAIPWLRRGMVLQITGIKNPTDQFEISIPPLFITEIRTTYDESQPGSHFVNQIRGFGWR